MHMRFENSLLNIFGSQINDTVLYRDFFHSNVKMKTLYWIFNVDKFDFNIFLRLI